MLLAIDIGNTNIQYGLYDRAAGVWCCAFRAQTVHHRMADEYAVLLRSFLAEAGFTFADVEAVVMASVVPALTQPFIDLCERYLQHTPLNVRSGVTNAGVRILLDQPLSAGADRIANAAAVKALYGGPAIVVDFGTSTNFDVINRDGDFIGGAIAIGIGLAHDALVSRAAQLYKVELVAPPSAIGRNTIHAMQSGLFLGYVSMIEGLIARLKAALDQPDTRVIATGGLAPLFREHIPAIDALTPTLTLDGLRIIWELNAG